MNKRSTHDVTRVTASGEPQETPCFCEADLNHSVGQERR